MRFEDIVSAEWAAGFFGKQEVRIKNVSSTSSGGGGGHSSGTTTSYQDQTRWVVEPSEFLDIAPPVNGQGITGFFALPLAKTTLFKDTIPAKWVFSGKTLAPESDRVIVARPDSQQRLQTTDADIEQLLKGRVQLTPQSGSWAVSGAGATMAPTTAPTLPLSAPPVSPAPPPVVAGPTALAPAQPAAPVAAASNGRVTTPPPAAPVVSAPSAPPPAQIAPGKKAKPAPGPSGASGNTNEPQVWDLTGGTIQPASIWSVTRTP